MSRPNYFNRKRPSQNFVRVNNRIRAREVRVVDSDGTQLGVLPVQEALKAARLRGVDLVEVASNANPPVCRLVDYGRYRYEQSKKDKESKKHQHVNKVKEVQLRPGIDPHDFKVKLDHTIDFLCHDMKVKVTLRFRGRENAHHDIGYQVVKKFVNDVLPFATVDSPPKLVGRSINVMISPLPKSKRAPNPREGKAPLGDLHVEPEDPEDHPEDLPEDHPEDLQEDNSAH